jgi:phage tail-like protein
MAASYGQFIVTRDGAPFAVFPLDRPAIRIGSAEHNDLVLPAPDVSSEHALIELGPDGPALRDLLSGRATYIKGEPGFLRRSVTLQAGMAVLIGPFALTYESGELQRHVQPDVSEIAPLHTPVPTNAPFLDGLSRYLDDLPAIFQPQGELPEEQFLGRYLLIFESIWEPLEQRQNHIERYFDPRTCPANFLPWLARWLDFTYDQRLPEGRIRAVLTCAMHLQRWRGAPRGLADLIGLCTGLRPDIVEDAHEPVFRVRVPHLAPDQRELIDDLIREYKPAYAGYCLEEQP